MPEEEYVWLSRDDLLHFEEISRLVDVFIGLGVDKVRLTGGEPLLRRNLCQLVELLAEKPLTDLALTTNGILLEEYAEPLKRAGLRRLNISLDTLSPDRFVRLTRQHDHARVMRGIHAAARVFDGTKLDAVIMRGVNDDELEPLLDFAASISAEVRFIEYMDVGGATRWSSETVVPRAETARAPARAVRRGCRRRGARVDRARRPVRPARRPRLRRDRVHDGAVLPRLRPGAGHRGRDVLHVPVCDGRPRPAAIRSDGATRPRPSPGQIEARWLAPRGPGAEERVEVRERSAFVPVSALRADPAPRDAQARAAEPLRIEQPHAAASPRRSGPGQQPRRPRRSSSRRSRPAATAGTCRTCATPAG